MIINTMESADDCCFVCFKNFNSLLQSKQTLGCHHEFCYECVKRLSFNSEEFDCPLCRSKNVSVHYETVTPTNPTDNTHPDSNPVVWLYESRDGIGWWMYDPATNSEIENDYQSGLPNSEFKLFGMKFIIDFDEFTQVSNVGKRKIKRIDENNRNTIPIQSIRGTAGVKKND